MSPPLTPEQVEWMRRVSPGAIRMDGEVVPAEKPAQPGEWLKCDGCGLVQFQESPERGSCAGDIDGKPCGRWFGRMDWASNAEIQAAKEARP